MMNRTSRRRKICCYLPEYNRLTDRHLQHVYDLLDTVSDRCDIFLVVSRSAGRTHPEFATHFYPTRFSSRALRMLETLAVFLVARLRGYRTFYVHYSLPNAILARAVTKLTGGTVHQWHCHCGNPKNGSGSADTNGNNLPQLRRMLHPWLKTTSLRLSDSVVVASPSVARWYQKNYGLSDDKFIILSPFVSADRFAPYLYVQGGQANKTRHVLFAHTLSREKGANHLCRIIPGISEALPEARFLVAGKGKYWSEISRLSKVVMLGAIPNIDMPLIYAESDLFIMPSEEEGVPHVLLEAMAMGVPFVATDVGGVADLVGESLRENLVPPGDNKAFVSRALEILKDRKLAAELRERCLDRARAFTLENAADQFLERIT